MVEFKSRPELRSPDEGVTVRVAISQLVIAISHRWEVELGRA
jgi:hypothetical protein